MAANGVVYELENRGSYNYLYLHDGTGFTFLDYVDLSFPYYVLASDETLYEIERGGQMWRHITTIPGDGWTRVSYGVTSLSLDSGGYRLHYTDGSGPHQLNI
jgi:hypothetical protein